MNEASVGKFESVKCPVCFGRVMFQSVESDAAVYASKCIKSWFVKL